MGGGGGGDFVPQTKHTVHSAAFHGNAVIVHTQLSRAHKLQHVTGPYDRSSKKTTRKRQDTGPSARVGARRGGRPAPPRCPAPLSPAPPARTPHPSPDWACAVQGTSSSVSRLLI